jgi:hypothetical protein
MALKNGKIHPIGTTRQLADFYEFDQHLDIFDTNWEALYDLQSPLYLLPPNCKASEDHLL